MKVAAVQYRPPKGEPERARDQIVAWTKAALGVGARLVVFPEMATTGYIWPSAEALAPHAERADGPTAAALAPLARQAGAWVLVGFPELAEDGGLYNAALLLGPDGAARPPYRKVLLYEADRPWARPGERRVLLESEAGLVAPAICMDMNDDGLIAGLHQYRVDVLAFLTNWVEEGSDVWAYWRRRLFGWRGALVAADTWGEDSGTRFAGRSVIWGPGGSVLASAGPVGDGLVVAEIPTPSPRP